MCSMGELEEIAGMGICEQVCFGHYYVQGISVVMNQGLKKYWSRVGA